MSEALPCNINKKRVFVRIDGVRVHRTVEDEIVLKQGKDKLIYLQKIRLHETGKIEYRFTYYMRGFKEGRMKGKWVFGQYSLTLPAGHLARLVAKARQRGWAGF